jgi:hypothetical protein
VPRFSASLICSIRPGAGVLFLLAVGFLLPSLRLSAVLRCLLKRGVLQAVISIRWRILQPCGAGAAGGWKSWNTTGWLFVIYVEATVIQSRQTKTRRSNNVYWTNFTNKSQRVSHLAHWNRASRYDLLVNTLSSNDASVEVTSSSSSRAPSSSRRDSGLNNHSIIASSRRRPWRSLLPPPLWRNEAKCRPIHKFYHHFILIMFITWRLILTEDEWRLVQAIALSGARNVHG